MVAERDRERIKSNPPLIITAQLIENQLDQLHMLGLDDSDRDTIPDCEIYPQLMGELSDQVMTREATVAALVTDEDDDDDEEDEEYEGDEDDDFGGGGRSLGGGVGGESMSEEPASNKTDLDYYILGAFSALNVSNLPLPIQVGRRGRAESDSKSWTEMPLLCKLFINSDQPFSLSMSPLERPEYDAPGDGRPVCEHHRYEQFL